MFFYFSVYNLIQFNLFVLQGDVTKIELELEEAPIDGSDGNEVDGLHAILVDSMSPESDSTAEINSTYPGGE